MLAKHALSQLSYGPETVIGFRRSVIRYRTGLCPAPITGRRQPVTDLVGLGGLEPPTSRLSSARSNQLSYKPEGQRPEVGSQKSEIRNSDFRLPSSDFYRTSPDEERETKAALSRKCGFDFKPLDLNGRQTSGFEQAQSLPLMKSLIQKGGDPAAGSPTA